MFFEHGLALQQTSLCCLPTFRQAAGRELQSRPAKAGDHKEELYFYVIVYQHISVLVKCLSQQINLYYQILKWF